MRAYSYIQLAGLGDCGGVPALVHTIHFSCMSSPGASFLNAAILQVQNAAREHSQQLAMLWSGGERAHLCISTKTAFEDDCRPMFKQLKKLKHRAGKLDCIDCLHVPLYGLVLDDRKCCPIMHLMLGLRVEEVAKVCSFFRKKDRDNYCAYLDVHASLATCPLARAGGSAASC